MNCLKEDVTWLKKYDELKQYKDREGHCNVPTTFNENKSLAIWVGTQRTQYRFMRQGTPSNITEQRIQHLENIGFQWNMNDLNDDNWYNKYEELKQYKDREGHCNVPRGFSENISLAWWVKKQRQQYKCMKQSKTSSMTEERIQHLENIGFQWSIKGPNDDAWYKKYEELNQYKDREGHCNVSHHQSNDKSLSKWVSYQRQQYKYMRQGRPSSMTEQRIQHLENIGFQWSIKDPNVDAWHKKYEELKQYKDREGHCNVPRGFSENISLARWVCNQRTQYKYMKQSKTSSMSEERIQHLENIGFQWSIKGPNDDAWYKKYEELKQYHDCEGNCNVSHHQSNDESLSKWVSYQRQQYKYMRQGRPSSMTEQRIQHLENIGFQWSIKYSNGNPL